MNPIFHPSDSMRNSALRYSAPLIPLWMTSQPTMKSAHRDGQGTSARPFGPTRSFRVDRQGWVEDIGRLSQISGIPITHFSDYLHALAERRVYFKSKGAVAIDLGVETPYTCQLSTAGSGCTLPKRAARRSVGSGCRPVHRPDGL